MNNDLNSLILSNARERVAKQHGYADWLQIDYSEMESWERDSLKLDLTEQAALLAMEELSAFYDYILDQENDALLYYSPNSITKKHFVRIDDMGFETRFTIEHLYTQYLNEKKDADK
jgi:hypothetical protein